MRKVSIWEEMVRSIQHFEGYLDRQVVQITPVQNSSVCVIQYHILHSRIVASKRQMNLIIYSKPTSDPFLKRTYILIT
jgi:hypothetical protein